MKKRLGAFQVKKSKNTPLLFNHSSTHGFIWPHNAFYILKTISFPFFICIFDEFGASEKFPLGWGRAPIYYVQFEKNRLKVRLFAI